jgi:hypothetical protein
MPLALNASRSPDLALIAPILRERASHATPHMPWGVGATMPIDVHFTGLIKPDAMLRRKIKMI